MRNRRKTRKNNKVIEILTNKRFIIICSLLIILIVILISIVQYRQYKDKQLLAKQKEELNNQTQQIFSEIEDQTKADYETSIKSTIAEISIVGDILCGNEMLNDAKVENKYNFNQMFTNISKYVKEADLTIGTLETNFTSELYSGNGKYNAPIEFLKAIKESGIGLASIAHNHELDYGEEGLNNTVQAIQNENISVTGIRNNKENENSEFTGNIKEIRGIKIAFLGYTYGLSNGENTNNIANVYNEELAKKDLDYAKANSNYIIVIMHWGEVNNNKITDWQNQVTDFLILNGADMILGSHPSVIEPMKIIKNNKERNILVAYSLGNYISSLKYEDANVELILNVKIVKNAEEEKAFLKKVDYTPIYVLDNGIKAENRYELTDMKALALDYANGDTKKISRKIYNNLITKLKDLEKIINSD